MTHGVLVASEVDFKRAGGGDQEFELHGAIESVNVAAQSFVLRGVTVGYDGNTNFTSGNSHSFGGEYLELVPHERIRYSATFDDPNLPGRMQTTITLKAVSCGTEMTAVQEGIPDVIPLEQCYLGWQESLASLMRLVEPEIPG